MKQNLNRKYLNSGKALSTVPARHIESRRLKRLIAKIGVAAAYAEVNMVAMNSRRKMNIKAQIGKKKNARSRIALTHTSKMLWCALAFSSLPISGNNIVSAASI